MTINDPARGADRPIVTGLLWRVKSRCTDPDAGFSMIEVVISLLIIAIVTTGSLTFFLNNVRSMNGQGQRQQAVALANQQIEQFQSVAPSKLVSGRTSANVNALFATPVAAKLKISTQDDTSSSANYDTSGGSLTFATQPPATNTAINGITYGLYNFIDRCWLDSSSGLCGPSSGSNKTPEYRATVDVRWQSNGLCATNCDYSTSTLIDPTADPAFNSNISTPAGNYYSVDGAPIQAGQTPNIPAMSKLNDTCTINGTQFSGTKVVVTGTGFMNNIRVWISTGGGTIVSGSIYQPLATEVDFCYQTGEVPGAYTISVINTDGGHFQLPVTIVPSITDAAGWDPVNKKLTITGNGLETGVTFSATNGASFSGTSNASYGNTTTNDTVALNNYVGTHDGTPTVITATNPDGSTATLSLVSPAVAWAFPTSVAVGQATNVTMGGTGFDQTLAAVVTNANGTASVTTVTGTTQATFSTSPTSTGSQGLYFYTDNGGYTTTGYLPVTAQPPNVTSFSPAEVTEDVLSGTITVNGTGFQSGMTAASNNGTVSSFTFVSSTKVTFKVTPANPGSDVITLTNPDGQTDTLTLVVPNITSFTPNPPVHSTATTWTINGTGFESGATVTINENGTNLAVSSTTFVNSTKITFRATTTSTTSTVNFVVTVKNPDNSQDSRTQSMRPT